MGKILVSKPMPSRPAQQRSDRKLIARFLEMVVGCMAGSVAQATRLDKRRERCMNDRKERPYWAILQTISQTVEPQEWHGRLLEVAERNRPFACNGQDNVARRQYGKMRRDQGTYLF
jgi:hypothetical protein